MPRVKKPPRWYFSLRSPYSWFAYLDLTQRYPEVADSLEWIPFWEPDRTTQAMLDEAGVVLPIVEMSRAKNFYILQDLARISKARGLRMTVPIDKDPNWEVSHLAYLAAKAQGLGPQFVDAVYRARWQEGRDITDPAPWARSPGNWACRPSRWPPRPTTPSCASRASTAWSPPTTTGCSASPSSSTDATSSGAPTG